MAEVKQRTSSAVKQTSDHLNVERVYRDMQDSDYASDLDTGEYRADRP